MLEAYSIIAQKMDQVSHTVIKDGLQKYFDVAVGAGLFNILSSSVSIMIHKTDSASPVYVYL